MKKFFDTGMPNVVSNVNQIKISRRYKNNASEFITRNRASMILCIVLLLLGGIAGGAEKSNFFIYAKLLPRFCYYWSITFRNI